MILTLFVFSAVKSVPANSAVDRNSSKAACSVTLRILTQAASLGLFVKYVSPLASVRATPAVAEVFFLSAPLPLPKRSFMRALPSPTAFFDLGRTMFWGGRMGGAVLLVGQ